MQAMEAAVGGNIITETEELMKYVKIELFSRKSFLKMMLQ